MNKVINGNITIYLQDLRQKRDIGYPYVIKPGTTLNDILDIKKDGYTTIQKLHWMRQQRVTLKTL